MAATRQATGHSKPRVVEKVETVAANPRKTATGKKRAAPKKTTATKKTTTKKTTAASKPKANTSVPRAKKESSAKVTKKPAAKKSTGAKPAAKEAVAKAKTAVKKASAPATKKEAAEPEQRGILEAAGAMAEGLALKAQGILTGSTGKKAAGTAKVRGTDKKPAAKK